MIAGWNIVHGITWRENIRKSYLSTSERVSLFRNYHGGRWVKIDQLLGLIWGGMIKVVDRYNITSDRISHSVTVKCQRIMLAALGDRLRPREEAGGMTLSRGPPGSLSLNQK